MKKIILTLVLFSATMVYSLEPLLYNDKLFDSESGRAKLIIHNDICYASFVDIDSIYSMWAFNGSAGLLVMLTNGNKRKEWKPEIISNELDDKILFSATSDSESGIWASDGSIQGTELIRENTGTSRYSNIQSNLNNNSIEYLKNSVRKGNSLYFKTSGIFGGNQVMESDGTAQNTRVITDFGSNDFIDMGDFASVEDRIIFTTTPRSEHFNRMIWSLDTETDSVIFLGDSNYGSMGGIFRQTYVNGRYIYLNNKSMFESDFELLSTDGTLEGTVNLIEDYENFTLSNQTYTLHNNLLYFTADWKDFGNELWVTDGTKEGTRMVKDINPDGSSEPELLFINQNKSDRLLFLATEGIYNRNRLVLTDGTEEGTELVSIKKTIDVDGRYSLKFNEERCFFVVDDRDNGNELWVTDYTEKGTYRVIDMNPDSKKGGIRLEGQVLNNRVLFSTSQESGVYDWYVTDGTAEGTVKLPEELQGMDSDRIESTIINGVLYFVVEDEDLGYSKLWRSDMTPEGTAPIEFENATNVNQIVGGLNIVELNGYVFFLANYYGEGSKIYRLRNTVSSVENDEQIGNVIVTPNPATNQIILNLNQSTNITITDQTGSRIDNMTLSNPYTIDVSNYNSGVYFITDKKGQLMAKFVKE